MNAPRDVALPRAVMEDYFHDLAKTLDGLIVASESYTANFSAEASDFVRMNRGRVRQPGSVAQRYLEIDLVRGAKHASHRLSLAGDVAVDRERLRAGARRPSRRACRPRDDPHLLIATAVASTRAARGGALPPAEVVIDAVLRCVRRARLRRALRRRTRLPRLRQFVRPAQLARGDVVQSAVEPLSPRRQGGEVGVVGIRVGRTRLRREDGRRARGARARREAGEDARARHVPHVPDARRDGGHRFAAVLGRVLGARARDEAELALPDAGSRRRRRAARSARDARRGDRRGRCAVVPGRRIRAAGTGAADRRRTPRRRAGVAADRARVLARDEWRQRLRGAGSAGDGRRNARREGCDGRARHRALRRQSPLPQLLRSAGVPDDRDDAVRDVLGRERARSSRR